MKRTNNEDAFLVNDPLLLYMVADGMGGHAGGEFASRIAVSLVEETMKVFHGGPKNHCFYFNERNQPITPEEALCLSIRSANAKILEAAQLKPELRGMGTTAVVIFFRNNKVYLAHVGDSRIYRIRKGTIRQMTDDHSLVNEQLRQGVITVDEAKKHQFKNVITRSVGIQDTVEVDTFSLDLKVGDFFLLCSDGLSNMVDDPTMLQSVSDFDLFTAGRHLIERACEKGGDDNITLILLQVLALS